jgi:hypothetical protein
MEPVGVKKVAAKLAAAAAAAFPLLVLTGMARTRLSSMTPRSANSKGSQIEIKASMWLLKNTKKFAKTSRETLDDL